MKTVNAQNLLAVGRLNEKKVWGRKTHSNKQTFTKVKCYHCQSEGCKVCDFSGLITIK